MPLSLTLWRAVLKLGGPGSGFFNHLGRSVEKKRGGSVSRGASSSPALPSVNWTDFNTPELWDTRNMLRSLLRTLPTADQQGLKEVTTKPPMGADWSTFQREHWQGTPLAGVYKKGAIHLNPDYLYDARLAKTTFIHELGHHVTMEPNTFRPWGPGRLRPELRTPAFRTLVSIRNQVGSPRPASPQGMRKLVAMGLSSYSLKDPYELAADTYLISHTGNLVQKYNLARAWRVRNLNSLFDLPPRS